MLNISNYELESANKAGKIYLTAAKIMGAKYFIVPLIGLGDGIVDELIENSRNVI